MRDIESVDGDEVIERIFFMSEYRSVVCDANMV